MSSYSEDKKIFETLSKIVNLEKQLGEDDGNKPCLLPVDKRKRLEEEKKKLQKEYNLLLIEVDRIEIRHSPDDKTYIDFLRYMITFDLHEKWDYYVEDILDFHESGDLLDRGRFLNNYYKLKPPYVRTGTKIPQGIKNIYHESRWCFVYGQYSAAIALSRTVIDTILKHKFNFEGDLNNIIDLAREKRFISQKAARNAHKVRMLANKILHKANVANENQAENSLDHILHFIEEIYLE